ncbi:DUF4271 domain-containing protein [Larkinella terrae]|uniref:DUF4271 domain-containing protein n=1 Tax=Larkinella terrae TaxID=2025311 RepID=A0A7K0EVW9_9BACT|nr:DUF4271 domain-containing protein [Larkinella terrae]MRS65568.1 DUF4271 domain-containing protein [Larkinella terrae]
MFVRVGLIMSALLLWAVGSFAQGVGPNQQFFPVHDFRNDWLVYDQAYKSYVPFIDEQHELVPSVSFFLDIESNRRYSLLVSTRQDGFLFIDAALKRKLIANEWLVLNLDSLYRVYRKPELFLTLHGSPGVEDKMVFIGHRKSTTQKNVIVADTRLSILPRRLSVYANFFTLCLLFIVAINAYLFNFHHRAFLRFFNLADLLSVTVRDELFLVNRPLSRTNLLFLMNQSFITAYLYLIIQSKNIDLFLSRALLLRGQGLLDLTLTFFELSFLAFFLLLAKYLFIVTIGGLYRLEEVVNLHFFKAMQSSLVFFTAGAICVATIAANTPTTTTWPSMWLIVPFVGFYVIRLALLYVVIANKAIVKNLYLFSYLCIVELIPLTIGVRFAL